ncbi:MAG: hypothetical protein M1431_02270 [Candidatus Thermoplasmatota archaeon]|nr:hypothetical protein [Candidatus Thermoplasmatota archaeon]
MRLKFGLVGSRISYSKSPPIHSLIMRISRIVGNYEIIDTPCFPDAGFLLSYNGLNITSPFKEDAIGLVHNLDLSAVRSGAVNTLLINGTVKGYNTDFLATRYLIDARQFDTHSALVFGSGGASKAAISALIELGSEHIDVVARNPSKVKSLISFFGDSVHSYGGGRKNYSVVVNGQRPEGFSLISKNAYNITFDSFIDFVYHAESPIIKLASLNGIKGITGRELLILQAIFSQEIWTGRDLSYLYSMEAFSNVV